MIELVRPTVDLADSWWRLVDAFGDSVVHGSSYRHSDRDTLRDPPAFEAWVDWLAEREHPGEHLGEGMVPSSNRWIVQDGRVVGTIALRHELTPALLVDGGHIGYAVEPGSRGRGVATAALRLALELARARGIDPVLITCDPTNRASAAVIEQVGGRLEDERAGSRRYWVETGGPAEPLSARPVQTRRTTLVLATRDQIDAMVAGERFDWFAEGYPREDDLDGLGPPGAELGTWSSRHIVRRHDGLAIGTIGCFGPPDDGQAEVGYGLVESARGAGLMTEVLGGFVRAVEAAGIRVLAHSAPDNARSQRVLARLGFERTGVDGEGDAAEVRWVRPTRSRHWVR